MATQAQSVAITLGRRKGGDCIGQSPPGPSPGEGEGCTGNTGTVDRHHPWGRGCIGQSQTGPSLRRGGEAALATQEQSVPSPWGGGGEGEGCIGKVDRDYHDEMGGGAAPVS